MTQLEAITPVEAIITSRWRISNRLAVHDATRRTASAPGLPVKELAQPAFTNSPRALPRFAASACLHQSVGAEPTAFVVNTPAAFVPAGMRMSSKSGRSCL